MGNKNVTKRTQNESWFLFLFIIIIIINIALINEIIQRVK